MEKIQGLIPEDFDQCDWHCVNDGVYLFAVSKEKIIDHKYALVKRKDDGSFDWSIVGSRFQGNEPSRKLAKEAVGKIFNSAIKLRESLK